MIPAWGDSTWRRTRSARGARPEAQRHAVGVLRRSSRSVRHHPMVARLTGKRLRVNKRLLAECRCHAHRAWRATRWVALAESTKSPHSPAEEGNQARNSVQPDWPPTCTFTFTSLVVDAAENDYGSAGGRRGHRGHHLAALESLVTAIPRPSADSTAPLLPREGATSRRSRVSHLCHSETPQVKERSLTCMFAVIQRVELEGIEPSSDECGPFALRPFPVAGLTLPSSRVTNCSSRLFRDVSGSFPTCQRSLPAVNPHSVPKAKGRPRRALSGRYLPFLNSF